MNQFERDIPLKQRKDVLEALDQQGIQAEITPIRGEGGDKCIVLITGAVKGVQQSLDAVLHQLRIPVETDAA